MSVSVSDGFLIYCAHLPESAKRRLHPSSQSGKPKEEVVRPRGDRHPQVTKLNITLSLDTQGLIKARGRGSWGGAGGGWRTDRKRKRLKANY